MYLCLLNRLIVLVVILVFGVNCAQAESLSSQFVARHKDFFQVYAPHKTDFEFRYIYQPNNEEDGGSGEYDLDDFVASFEIPILLSPDTFLKFKPEYEARHYDFKSINGLGSEILHKGVVSFGFGHFFSKDLFITALATPGVYSDFDETIEVDDFRLFGNSMLVYRINPGTQLLFGVEVSETFDDIPVLPIIGLRSTSEDGRIYLSLTAPIEARVGWNFDPRAQVYGLFSIRGDEYRAHFGPDGEEFDIHVQDRRLGVGVLYWLGNRINVGLEGGLSIDSEFEFKNSSQGQFRDDIDPAGYVSLGLGFSL